MTMPASELRDLEPDELAAKLAEAKEELFNLRFQNVTGQLDNPHRLREVLEVEEEAEPVVPAAEPAPAEREGEA